MTLFRKLVIGGMLACGVACGDSSDDDAGSGGPAKYALSVIVFNADDTTNTYVSFVDSLDITKVDVKSGIEFAGQANIASYGGKFYISDGEEPTVTRYTVSEDGELEEEAKISFAKYGEGSVSVDDTSNVFVSATKAYMSGPDGSLIVWNPTTMKLTGEIPVKAPIKDMGEDFSLNTTVGAVRGNRLYRTFSWINWLTYEFADDQFFAVYDTDKDELLTVTSEDRCPALSALPTIDDKDNVYFSNWFYNLAGTLQSGAPSACALRVKKGSDALDPDWTLDFTKLTDGHEGAQLTYTSKGQALFAAFHEENIEVKPDDSPYDIVSSENWETWTIDLAKEKATPVKGVDLLGAQQTVFTLDGRTFLFAPNQDFDKTKVYEVSSDGSSHLAFTLDGWSRAFLKLE